MASSSSRSSSSPPAPPILPSFWTFWTRPQQANARAYLLDWVKRVPVNANDTDVKIADAVRDYLYGLLNWTGTQAPGCTNIDFPDALLQWQTEHQGDNGGIGPTWSCGPFSALYVGLLALYGIAARRVWSSSMVDGGVDTAAEYWDRQELRWVFVVPHINTHWAKGGRRINFYEWCQGDRCGQDAKAVPISGNGEPKYSSLKLKQWKNMSGNPCLMRGNWPHAGGGDQVHHENYEYFQLMPIIGAGIPLEDLQRDYGTFDTRSYSYPP